MQLPQHFEPYTDKYFLRSLEILQKEKLNPFVRAQIFVRSRPGFIYGLNDAVAVIEKVSKLRGNGGRIYSLAEGDSYESGETVMLLEGRIQDIIYLETLILGFISSQTTWVNDKKHPEVAVVQKNVSEIVKLVKRPASYFGARHYRYDEDREIAQAAFAAGATGASTDCGASVIGKKGVGTIPHSLETIFAWKYGRKNAVVKTTEAFDKDIDSSVPRIALVDFNNKEIDDSLGVANALKDTLYGIRVDTSGENTMQEEVFFPKHKDDPYWQGKGVTIGGVYKLRTELLARGFSKVKIVLSSGFGNIAKVQAFVAAEKELGISLFDELGVGQVYPARIATMDIVGVGESLTTIQPMAKVGRAYCPNTRVQER
jgi:nicotinate phosphoribosyltransferase